MAMRKGVDLLINGTLTKVPLIAAALLDSNMRPRSERGQETSASSIKPVLFLDTGVTLPSSDRGGEDRRPFFTPLMRVVLQTWSMEGMRNSSLFSDVLEQSGHAPSRTVTSVAKPWLLSDRLERYGKAQSEDTLEFESSSSPKIELMGDEDSVVEQLKRDTSGVVTLNTWSLDLIKGNVGHAALYIPAVEGHLAKYISHWPNASVDKGEIVPSINQTYEEDVIAEGGPPVRTQIVIPNIYLLHEFLEAEMAPRQYALDRLDVPNCVDRVSRVLSDGAKLTFDPSTFSIGDGPLDRVVHAKTGKVTPNALMHSLKSEQRFRSFQEKYTSKVDNLEHGRVQELDATDLDETSLHEDEPRKPGQ